jgi:ferredoxin
MKVRHHSAKPRLRARLKELAVRDGAVAFGVASAKAVDSLPRIKIGWTINRYTVKLNSVMPGAESVIVFGIPSMDDADELEIDRGEGIFSYPGYQPIRVIQRDLIRILTSEGYRANSLSEETSTTSYKRIASLAGIGCFGKSSLVLSPRYGPWLRLGLVLTDAPLKPDKPFKKDLCQDCVKCLRACPAGALTQYRVDPDKCLVGATSAGNPTRRTMTLLDKYEPKITARSRVMCRICQMACPYTPAERRKGTFVR